MDRKPFLHHILLQNDKPNNDNPNDMIQVDNVLGLSFLSRISSEVNSKGRRLISALVYSARICYNRPHN